MNAGELTAAEALPRRGTAHQGSDDQRVGIQHEHHVALEVISEALASGRVPALAREKAFVHPAHLDIVGLHPGMRGRARRVGPLGSDREHDPQRSEVPAVSQNACTKWLHAAATTRCRGTIREAPLRSRRNSLPARGANRFATRGGAASARVGLTVGELTGDDVGPLLVPRRLDPEHAQKLGELLGLDDEHRPLFVAIGFLEISCARRERPREALAEPHPGHGLEVRIGQRAGGELDVSRVERADLELGVRDDPALREVGAPRGAAVRELREVPGTFRSAARCERCEVPAASQHALEILVVLLKTADLYIIDEPLAGVDVDSKGKVMRSILQSTEGKTLLVIMHGASEFHGDFDRVLDLTQIESGKPALTVGTHAFDSPLATI